MREKREVVCSLVINVARGDTPILEYTLPHILNTHKVRFAEVLIVVDEKLAEGRIGKSYPQHSLHELYEILGKVKKRGYEFRQEVVSYRQEDVDRTYEKWFGRSLGNYRCAGGTPIYAFLCGLELARHDICLHLDSDMLIYDPGPLSWTIKAIEILKEIPEVLFVNQTWGLQTKSSPAPESMPSVDLGYGQRVSKAFSSRCFLFSMKKIESTFLPIAPAKHPLFKRVAYYLQNRSQYLALEQMVSKALVYKHMYRADLDNNWGFNLHAWDKTIFRNTHIENVLQEISEGRVPVKHISKHNLDYDLFLEER